MNFPVADVAVNALLEPVTRQCFEEPGENVSIFLLSESVRSHFRCFVVVNSKFPCNWNENDKLQL